MDWIKKNPEKFSLTLLSVALLAVACYLFYIEQNFAKSFDSLKVPPVQSTKLPPLDTKSMQGAQASLDKPETWAYDSEKQGSLFVSQPYVVLDKDSNGTVIPPPGKLVIPDTAIFYPPVPNKWLLKYHLDLMDSNVIYEDPDGDGFSTVEEYLARTPSDSPDAGGTDPTDKNSHPPYTTKLFLEQYIPIPFRLVFNGQPDDKSFQIDTVDVHQPTQILQMGDAIANTTYKIVGFQKKMVTEQSTGAENDVSELTVQNTETGKKVVLVLGVVTNDPDSYALFRYFWKGSKPIRVKLDATFTLDPETDVNYKVIDIKKDQATIVNLKTNKEITIPIMKKGVTFHWP